MSGETNPEYFTTGGLRISSLGAYTTKLLEAIESYRSIRLNTHQEEFGHLRTLHFLALTQFAKNRTRFELSGLFEPDSRVIIPGFQTRVVNLSGTNDLYTVDLTPGMPTGVGKYEGIRCLSNGVSVGLFVELGDLSLATNSLGDRAPDSPSIAGTGLMPLGSLAKCALREVLHSK